MMNYRNEILKRLSLEELEVAISTKKTELKGLISTEGCEFIIAEELGIQTEASGNEFLEPKDDTSEKGVSGMYLINDFIQFVEKLEENNDFLEMLSKTLGKIFAHNECCHQGHNIPDVEGIDFNKFTKDIQISYYEVRMSMNAEWFYQLKRPVNIEDKEAFEGNEEYYRHVLGHIKTSECAK